LLYRRWLTDGDHSFKPRKSSGVTEQENVQRAAELIRASGLNFHGYVEGDDIYAGTTDVVVCDGFVGNVALKASEGLARMITHFIKQEFKRNLLTKLSALVALPVLQAFRKRVDPRRYNGATFIGLTGTVIKSHGGADVLAVHAAPKPPPERVTLSAARLSRTRQALFLVSGAGKRAALSAWRQGRDIPARHIAPPSGVELWLDADAATEA